jgi:hypothetical protein
MPAGGVTRPPSRPQGIALALVYAAAVLFLVQLVPIMRGGLAVAVSTLAFAALLRPLWRRSQDAVNRRFSALR